MENHTGSFYGSGMGIAYKTFPQIPLVRTHACDPIWLQGGWQMWSSCVPVKKGSGSLEQVASLCHRCPINPSLAGC